MLFRRQCGNAHQQRHQTGSRPIPERNILLPTQSYVAEPAHQTMYGRKQIIRCIYGIQKNHHLIPEPLRLHHRSGIRSGIRQIADQTDHSGKEISRKKTAYLFFPLSPNQNVVDNPEQITSKVNDNRWRPEWNQPVKTSFNIVMRPFSARLPKKSRK